MIIKNLNKILTIIVLLFISLTHSAFGVELKKVNLQLSWFDQFQFAGYYIAKEKGFYEQAGLDVAIQPFEFGVDTASGVSDGMYDFAIGRETLLLEKSKGKDIVALYAIFQSSPLVLLSTKESGIDSIEQFKDKTVMTTIDDASEVSLKAMIVSKKINLSQLNFIDHTHNINDLIEKKTDIISAYISKSPFELQQKGVPYNVFAPRDYGFDMYSDFLITSNRLIDKDPNTVVNFMEASLKGWEYAYENIEETVALILEKYNTQKLSKEELIYEAKELKKLSYYKTKKLGEINLAKLQRIHDLYNIMGVLPKKIDINSFFFQKRSFYSNLHLEEKEFILKNELISVGESSMLKPLNYLDAIGVHGGILHDYLNIISEKTGLRFVSQVDTSSNLIAALKNGTIQMIDNSLYIDGQDLLVSKPYFTLNETAFKLKNNMLYDLSNVGVLSSIKSPKRQKILQEYSQKLNIYEYENIKELTQALVDKEVDIVYLPEEIFLNHIKDSRIKNIDYAQTPIPQNQLQISFVFSSEAKILEEIISKAISDISKEQHLAIRNKWIPLVFENNFDWKGFWEVIVIIALFILMGIYNHFSQRKFIKILKKNQLELKDANEQLRELSQLDHLTKLHNRRYFEQIAEDILHLEQRLGKTTSLIMFDIDDFKKINDTFGHKAGDIVLQDLGRLLLRVGRKSDISARIGGEEFVVLLPDTDIHGAKIHAYELKKAIEDMSVEYEGNTIKITASMGLTQFRENDTLSKVLVRADENQYISKKLGKNQVTVS